MNYIIEGGIDFWDELNNGINELNEKEKCLLTNEILSRNCITLPCSHKFNYVPLCNEIIHSKQYQKYNKFPLRSNQIRCPYCRTTHNTLLLWIPIEDIKYDKLVHSLSKPLKHKECQYCFKSGKNKGKKCADLRGYEDDKGLIFCKKHRKKRSVSAKKTSKNITKLESTFLKTHLKREIMSILEGKHVNYKKYYTKLDLMRLMQSNNIPLTLNDKNQNEIIT